MHDIDTRRRHDLQQLHRVPPTEITGIMGALAKRFSKKMLGQVPEPLQVMWHNRRVLKAFFGSPAKPVSEWDACDTQLKTSATWRRFGWWTIYL